MTEKALCVIDTLPDSLLLYVFELDHGNNELPTSQAWRSKEEKSTIRSISSVCKRWNAISAPLMYRHVRTELSRDEGRNRDCQRLLNNLLNDTALPTWTKEVFILIDNMHSADFEREDAAAFVNILRLWRPSLRGARVHGNIGLLESRSVLFQLSKMPLEEISFSGYQGGISLSFFLKYFQYPGLKKLRLDRVSWNRNRDLPGGAWQGEKRDPYVDEDHHLPEERRYTTELKALHISDPAVPARTLRILFKWPRALKSVKFSYLMMSMWADRYHTRAIQELLDLQAHSLRSIECGHIAQFQSTIQIPDFTDMIELESLRLNKSCLFNLPVADICRKLSAPKLKTFILVFDTEDQHGTSSDEVDKETIKWLVDFARTWRSSRRQEAGSILQIHFDFCPEMPWGSDPEEIEWPWRYLEIARSEIEQYNVELTWTEPRWNAQQWYDGIKESWDAALEMGFR